MIQKAAKTGLTKALALQRFKEAREKDGAVVEMIEQDDGLWTVTIVWDDDDAPVTFEDLLAFDETRGTVPSTGSSATDELGSLSRRFESNGKPGAIGFDKTGGFSYGAYQIATKTGTMAAFLKFLPPNNFSTLSVPLEAAGGNEAAKAGSDEFRSAWQNLAKNPEFLKAQHAFIAATHYEPFAQRLAGAPLLLNLKVRQPVLRDVAWSVAVQHGPDNKVFINALQHDTREMSDREIIEAVYAERSNVGKYFSKSAPKVQAVVQSRFAEERQLALSRLA